MDVFAMAQEGALAIKIKGRSYPLGHGSNVRFLTEESAIMVFKEMHLFFPSSR
jgi:hypothetical protein